MLSTQIALPREGVSSTPIPDVLGHLWNARGHARKSLVCRHFSCQMAQFIYDSEAASV